MVLAATAGWAAPAGPPAQIAVEVYSVVNRTVDGQPVSPSDLEQWRRRPLHLVPEDRTTNPSTPATYWWAETRAPYRLTRGGQGIELECHRGWIGEVVPPSMTFTWTQHLGKIKHAHEILVRHAGQRLVRLSDLPRSQGCPEPSAGAQPVDRMERRVVAGRAVPAGAAGPGPVAQAGVPPRILDGELLLSVNRSNRAIPLSTRDDLRLWECLVTRSIPAVRFDDGAGDTREAFVWPDGRFRTELRPGVRYTWTLGGTTCGTAAQVGATVQGDAAAVVRRREKLLLACYVAERRFEGCAGWWLIQP